MEKRVLLEKYMKSNNIDMAIITETTSTPTIKRQGRNSHVSFQAEAAMSSIGLD